MKTYFSLLLFFFTTFSAIAQPTLAVLGGAADESDFNVATIVIDAISEELVRSGVYTVVERKELDVAISEQDFQLSGNVQDSDIIDVASFKGAESVALIRVVSLGLGYFITARIIDVETGKIEKQVSESNVEESHIISASKSIAAKLIGVDTQVAQVAEIDFIPEEVSPPPPAKKKQKEEVETKPEKRGGLFSTFSTVTFNYQGGRISNFWNPHNDDDWSGWDDGVFYPTHAATAKAMFTSSLIYLGGEFDAQFIGVTDSLLAFLSASVSGIVSIGINLNFLNFIQPYLGVGLGLGFHPILYSAEEGEEDAFIQFYGVTEFGVNVLFVQKLVFHLGGIYRDAWSDFPPTYKGWAWKIGLGYSPDF